MVGGLCALVGVFILTLPIPIVVNSFAAYYKNRLWRNEVAHKRAERMKRQTATANMNAAAAAAAAAAANDEVRKTTTMPPPRATSPRPTSSTRKGRPQEDEANALISPNGIEDLGQGDISVMRLREIQTENSQNLSHSDIQKWPDSKN